MHLWFVFSWGPYRQCSGTTFILGRMGHLLAQGPTWWQGSNQSLLYTVHVLQALSYVVSLIFNFLRFTTILNFREISIGGRMSVLHMVDASSPAPQMSPEHHQESLLSTERGISRVPRYVPTPPRSKKHNFSVENKLQKSKNEYTQSR